MWKLTVVSDTDLASSRREDENPGSVPSNPPAIPIEGNIRVLAGLDEGGKPEVTERVCRRLWSQYRHTASVLWGKEDQALLTPLVTGAMPFLVRSLTFELSTNEQLCERLWSAIHRLIDAETQWARNLVQQRCRFLVALGELCLIGFAAQQNHLTLRDGKVSQRLAELLCDGRWRIWHLGPPVEVGNLLTPLHSLAASGGARLSSTQHGQMTAAEKRTQDG